MFDDELTPFLDLLLQIQNPQKVKAKRQPTGVSKKAEKKQNQYAEQKSCSTQRDPSGSEYASKIGFTSEV